MNENNLPSGENKNAGLNRAIDSLLNEKFARENGFSETSIEKIGELLEETPADFEGEAATGNDAIASDLKESFERCKLVYCTLLLEIESQKLESSLNDTLTELRQREQHTTFIQVPQIENSIGEDDPFEPIQPLMPEVPGQTTISEMPDDDDEVPFETAALEATMPAEDDIKPMHNLMKDLASVESAANWDLSPLNEGTLHTANSTEDSHLELEPINSTTIPTLPDSLALADHFTNSEVVTAPDLEEATEADVAEIRTVERVSPEPVPRTDDYRRLSDFLNKMITAKSSLPVPTLYVARLVGHTLCCSLELELTEKLMPGIKTFWNNREPMVATLLDTKNKKFELHPILRAAINQMAAENPDWLLESKFPHPAVLNSLHYIVATTEISKLRPTLLDIAVLMFFFGREHSLGGFPLKNQLQIEGLPQDHFNEMTLRLLRLHKLRGRTISVHSEFQTEHLTMLRSDIDRIVTLLRTIEVPDATKAVQQVA